MAAGTERHSLSVTGCPRRPSGQVKWNRVSSQTLASSHEGDIRVWDRRKLSIPERYISAHTAKIHGLDWSPNVVGGTWDSQRASVVGTALWEVLDSRNYDLLP